MIKLETERLIIRDPIIDDLESHHKLLSDEKAMYYLQDIKTKSLAESHENLLSSIKDSKSKQRKFYFFKIIERSSLNHIGDIGYTVTDFTPVGKFVHLGYFTHENFWSKGYVTEAIKEVIRFAFEENDVYRITTGCLSENVGSEKVMQKCGFIKEAEHKDYELHDGKVKTRVEYRLLKSEWIENKTIKTRQLALDYLYKNKLMHIDMIEPIRRNTCDVLYADNNGVLINERNSNSYMLSTYSLDLAKNLINNLPKKDLFVIHQNELFDLVKNKFEYKNHFECKQSAYLKNIPPKLNDNIEIRLLEDNDKAIVRENYKSMDEDFDYTSFLIDEKCMWGAFDNDALMGFIGIHSEGSMGLLEVLPYHRNKGVALALQSYLIDYMLKKDWIPFGQVFFDNDKSLNLQCKLGLEISKESVFWLY